MRTRPWASRRRAEVAEARVRLGPREPAQATPRMRLDPRGQPLTPCWAGPSLAPPLTPTGARQGAGQYASSRVASGSTCGVLAHPGPPPRGRLHHALHLVFEACQGETVPCPSPTLSSKAEDTVRHPANTGQACVEIVSPGIVEYCRSRRQSPRSCLPLWRMGVGKCGRSSPQCLSLAAGHKQDGECSVHLSACPFLMRSSASSPLSLFVFRGSFSALSLPTGSLEEQGFSKKDAEASLSSPSPRK